MEDASSSIGCGHASTPETVTDEVTLDSVTLARLLAEVRNDEPVEVNAYNRMHNRHNR